MYNLYTNGTQVGPFEVEQLRGMLAVGLITLRDPVWKEGMPESMPVEALLREDSQQAARAARENGPPIAYGPVERRDGLLLRTLKGFGSLFYVKKGRP